MSLNEEMTLEKGANRPRSRGFTAGFSMIELVVSMCILAVLTGIAIPSLMQSLRTYQLNDMASRLADIVKFTRFEAVRQNTQLNLQITQNGTDWRVWTDELKAGNGGPLDPSDKQLLVNGFATLLPAGGGPPAPNAITAQLGVAGLTVLSGANNSVTFDARGAIRAGIGGPVANTVYVIYVGSAIAPEFGYRAVVLLPSGSTQIWTASAGGQWQQIS